jgi:heme A synthase
MLLKPVSIATLCVLFSLMFIGAYVSSSGVGLSCPKWPLCPAGLVPMKEFIIEYIHRTVAAITGLLVFATTFFTLRSKLTSRNVKKVTYCSSNRSLGSRIGLICYGLDGGNTSIRIR